MPSSRVKLWLELSKSGIVTLVVLSVLGGFLSGQALDEPFRFREGFLVLAGLLLLSSGSSALNQIQEAHIDAEMPRTSGRPIPSGRLPKLHAIRFAVLAIASGLATLAFVSPTFDLTLFFMGLAALISYNGLYTLWWKRTTPWAAIPGAIPGAIPAWMGYIAARPIPHSTRLSEPAGLYLFALLFFWQMPHFWSLALKYRDDYARGGFPTLPVARGDHRTRVESAIWCLGYVLIGFSAPLFLSLGPVYWFPSAVLSAWTLLSLRAFLSAHDPKAWIRFFLRINLSLIGYLAFAAIDHWHVYLVPFFTR